jgi:hypothetical protein
MEPNFFHREDHYWACIIAWLKRALVKNPDAINDNDSLITFKKVVVKDKKETAKSKSDAAKNYFGRLLSMHKKVTEHNKRT